ncbi:MAG TPA: hypothetical protein DCO68_00195 [Methylophilaceae bacterium]|nr:hypothetical protein [Methylophilaceae bacterium]HAJ70476.1 hypothetical protein [Methylophilaceae bacterium]
MEISQYWKLADQLSVHDAACLIIGVDPEETRDVFEWSQDHELLRHVFKRCPAGYVATRNALLAGIRSKVIDGYYHNESDTNGNEWTDISQCFVVVESLKNWLLKKGFDSGFFFPESSKNELDYLNKNHPHYSPKLAAAISAWQAISNDPIYQNKGKTVKQNLINWLTSHAAEFNLIKEDGEININAIDNQVSIVANWDTSGGAPKTPV